METTKFRYVTFSVSVSPSLSQSLVFSTKQYIMNNDKMCIRISYMCFFGNWGKTRSWTIGELAAARGEAIADMIDIAATTSFINTNRARHCVDTYIHLQDGEGPNCRIIYIIRSDRSGYKKRIFRSLTSHDLYIYTNRKWTVNKSRTRLVAGGHCSAKRAKAHIII